MRDQRPRQLGAELAPHSKSGQTDRCGEQGMTTRRSILKRLPSAVVMAALAPRLSLADDKHLLVGIDVSLTGAGAEDAILVRNGAMLAIDEANAAGGVAGYMIEPMGRDDSPPAT